MTLKKMSLALAASAVGVIAVAAAAFFFLPHGLQPVTASATALTGQALIDRGHYLTIAGDCAACHTAPGGKPFAGGLPFKLPFGTIYSANITPDKQAGLGDWNAAEFVRAMRHGVGKRGEDLYPAFPYTSYALLRDDDMLAIFAYLETLPPVAEVPPENALTFPFNQRWTLRAWKLLFLDDEPLKDDPSRSDEWNQGAYLVEGLAHCGECHTPRNLLFAREQSKALSGGAVDGTKAWNITPDPLTGIGKWNDDALVSYLAIGAAAGHGSATGSMRQAIDLSFSKLSSSDLKAMAAYLRSMPPIRSGDIDADVSSSSQPMRESTAWSASAEEANSLGRSLFAGACASCHGWDGSGQATGRQALAGDHDVSDPEGANLVRLLLQGSNAQGDEPSTAMPSFADAYTDTEIAAISNYVIGHFGGKIGKVTEDSVKSARQ